MTFNPSTLTVNVPFNFQYTLSPTQIANTVDKVSPAGIFYIGIEVPQQLNLGNGTNVQTNYDQINVRYIPGQPLNFPNRSYNVSGNYVFNLYYFFLDTYNYQTIVYTTRINFQSTPIIHCFNEGTKILCINKKFEEEYISIENLRKGDLVKTLKNDYLSIVLIGKSPIYNSGDLVRLKNRLYILSKHLFPSLTEDLVLTGCHSILVDGLYKEQIFEMGGPDKRLYKTDDKLRLFTCFEPKAIPYQEEGTFTIYHLALESENDEINFGIWANGLLVESCSKLGLRDFSGIEFIN
jgi:hypothetical protein